MTSVGVTNGEGQGKAYVQSLEERLASRSDHLEELHMEAAIDAQLTDTTKSRANPIVTAAPQSPKSTSNENNNNKETMFDDYVNPNAVDNCWSPYMPTKADRIAAFVSFVGLNAEDVLLDIGCGDGRVCVAALKLSNCRRAVGVDVSPACIEMARQVAIEEGFENESTCLFYELDATMAPDQLLAAPSLSETLLSVTVIFLYTYPTLLERLVPLLEQLSEKGNLKRVVTLTYHLPDALVEVGAVDDTYDFRLYTRIKSHRESV